MENADWHWGVSNLGPVELLIWLEPWAEHFEVPARSNLTIKLINEQFGSKSVEIEDRDECIVVWAGGGDRMEIYIDGVIQQSASAVVEVPELFGESTKEILSIMFQNQPTARLGGQMTDTNNAEIVEQKTKN